MRFISLFSGIEAASVAWLPLGWECAAVAEIDKFPCVVLKHHYPDVPNLGDITKITETQIKALGHIDVAVFGSPCTDVSVAGKRAGLVNAAGERTRSGLFFNAMDVVKWSNAEWVVFENVPGLISSNKGDDFDLVLDSFEALGYHVEVDICDAQFFGVPQRRRRVFVICHKLDAGLRKKTLLSAVITLKLLFSIWQQSWDEVTRRSKPESNTSISGAQKLGRQNKKTTFEPTSGTNQTKKSPSISTEAYAPSKANASDSASTMKACAAGLRKKTELFETLLHGLNELNMGPASLETLLSVLDETFRSSLSGPKNSDADSVRPINGNHSGADTDESPTPPASWCLSTLPSWKAVLDASCNLLNESTTSTESNQTTETTTYIFAQACLSIAASTASLLKLLPNSWREELSLSIMIRDVMKFAKERIKNGSPNIQISGRTSESVCDWLLILWQAEYQNESLRHLGNGGCSPTLFPFSESLSGDLAPSREKRQSAPTIPARRSAGGGLGTDFDCDGGLVPTAGGPAKLTRVMPTLRAGGNRTGGDRPYGTDVDTCDSLLVTHSLRADGFDASEDGTGRGTPLVPVGFMPARTFGKDGGIDIRYAPRNVCDALHTASGGGNKAPLIAFSCKDSGLDCGELSPTLRSMNSVNSNQNSGGQVAIAFSNVSDGSSIRNATDITDPLTCRHGDPGMVAVAIRERAICENPLAGPDGVGIRTDDQAYTVKARREGGGLEGSVMTPAMQVRRLLPEECEKLQGFPPGYTKINEKTADGPRYKALGNSFAVPVVAWIGRRIQLVDLFS